MKYKGVPGHTKPPIRLVDKPEYNNFLRILTIVCNITKFRGGQFQI